MYKLFLNPLSGNFTKWPNTLRQFVGNLPTNWLSVFGYFVGLALKGLTEVYRYIHGLSPEIINEVFSTRANFCNTRQFNVFETHIPTSNRYGLNSILTKPTNSGTYFLETSNLLRH